VAKLTELELLVVASWWHVGSVVDAAKTLNISEQTAKNVLHTARLRSGAPNTLALARMYSRELPSLSVCRRKARKPRREHNIMGESGSKQAPGAVREAA
jgi:hypothetical protein